VAIPADKNSSTNLSEKYLEYKFLEIKMTSRGQTKTGIRIGHRRIRVIKKLSETSSNLQEIHKKALMVTAHIL
jgi:hypothetical protein